MVFQWRIQDFPQGNANPKCGANLLFGIILAENSMKMKKIGLRKGRVSLTPHPRSATDIIFMAALNPFTRYHQV